MQSTQPITIDGVTYDRLHVKLSMATRIGPQGEFTGSASVRLIPFTIGGDGQEHTLEEQAVSITVPDTAASEGEIGTAVSAIAQAIQAFITGKGF
jgi:hypothetical protein